MKIENYEKAIKEIEALISGEKDLIANLSNIAAVLKLNFNYYSWAGFYFLKGEDLVLGPFQGKPACLRIKNGNGICGKAAMENRSLIVKDVSKFPGHISCDSRSKSEIVVPIAKGGKAMAVIDIDSHSIAAFDETDKKYLEKLALIISGIF